MNKRNLKEVVKDSCTIGVQDRSEYDKLVQELNKIGFTTYEGEEELWSVGIRDICILSSMDKFFLDIAGPSDSYPLVKFSDINFEENKEDSIMFKVGDKIIGIKDVWGRFMSSKGTKYTILETDNKEQDGLPYLLDNAGHFSQETLETCFTKVGAETTKVVEEVKPSLTKEEALARIRRDNLIVEASNYDDWKKVTDVLVDNGFPEDSDKYDNWYGYVATVGNNLTQRHFPDKEVITTKDFLALFETDDTIEVVTNDTSSKIPFSAVIENPFAIKLDNFEQYLKLRELLLDNGFDTDYEIEDERDDFENADYNILTIDSWTYSKFILLDETDFEHKYFHINDILFEETKEQEGTLTLEKFKKDFANSDVIVFQNSEEDYNEICTILESLGFKKWNISEYDDKFDSIHMSGTSFCQGGDTRKGITLDELRAIVGSSKEEVITSKMTLDSFKDEFAKGDVAIDFEGEEEYNNLLEKLTELGFVKYRDSSYGEQWDAIKMYTTMNVFCQYNVSVFDNSISYEEFMELLPKETVETHEEEKKFLWKVASDSFFFVDGREYLNIDPRESDWQINDKREFGVLLAQLTVKEYEEWQDKLGFPIDLFKKVEIND